MRDVLGEAAQQWQARSEHLGVAAHQQVEPTLGGFLRGARHRRIEKLAALGLHGLCDFGRGIGHGGRAVDHHGAGAQAGQRTLVTQHHRFDLRRAGDAEDQHVDLRGQCRHVRHRRGARREQRTNGLVAGVIEDGQPMAVLDDVLRDAAAHQADADQADASGRLCFLCVRVHGFVHPCLMAMVLRVVKPSRASKPFSRPKPLDLTPPNGNSTPPAAP